MESGNIPKSHHYNCHQKRKNSNKVKKKPIKVTYISSPVMVKANNAFEFRAIVQELTGQNSDVVTSPCNSTGTVVSTEEAVCTVNEDHGSPGDKLGNHEACTNMMGTSLFTLEEDFLWREFVDNFQFPRVLV